MEIIDMKKNQQYLKEYITLCNWEWGEKRTKGEMEKYIVDKERKILTGDKVISVLGLVQNDSLLGFISLFKYEDEYRDREPWYATMYVKEEYRKRGYSRILNDAILTEAKKLGYEKVYLKSELTNYYEKFGAKYIDDLDNGEKLYYIDLN